MMRNVSVEPSAVGDIRLHFVQIDFAYRITILIVVGVGPVHVDIHDVFGDDLNGENSYE